MKKTYKLVIAGTGTAALAAGVLGAVNPYAASAPRPAVAPQVQAPDAAAMKASALAQARLEHARAVAQARAAQAHAREVALARAAAASSEGDNENENKENDSADEPKGGHEDPAGKDVKHEFQGVE